MKNTVLFALLVVIGATAHASSSISLTVPTRVHLSTLSAMPLATAKVGDSIATVPLVAGVTPISNSEAASVHGKSWWSELFHDPLGTLWDDVKKIVRWVLQDGTVVVTYDNSPAFGSTTGRVTREAY